MLDKVVIDLIYEGETADDNGSPHTITTTEQNVRADLIDNFSSYYYNDNQRDMRLSKNFIVPKYLKEDRLIDGVNYVLKYVSSNNKTFVIKNILKNKGSYLTCILDTQEIRK